jgi:hypothetical protein
MLPGSPQLLLSQPGPATRNGLSLACNGSRFREPHSRVNGPDLLLRCLAASWTARSALLLHYRTPVRPGFGCFVASGPLQFCLPLRLTASPISTPLRGLYSPPDQSVRPGSLPVGPPSESARFPLAPRYRSFFKCGCGSPFLVRYVSGGLLFLKPLGTFFTMIPKPLSVNAFLCRFDLFPQHLFVVFRIGYAQPQVTILWIKRALRDLFLRY